MRRLSRLALVLIIGTICAFPLFSQSIESESEDGFSLASDSTENDSLKQGGMWWKKALPGIKFGGYYRFYGLTRQQPEPFKINAEGTNSLSNRVISVGDGYREPMLMLHVSGKPLSNITFGTDLFIFSPYLGSNEGNVFTLNLGINFYGSINTKHGTFDIQAGGINWYNQSPLTIGILDNFSRYSLFERLPWEANTKTMVDKYSNYYQNGSIAQDNRFGNRAFKGISINAHGLPKGLTFKGLVGKMQNNIQTVGNDFAFGGRLSKKFEKQKFKIAVNHFTSSTQSFVVKENYLFDTVIAPDTTIINSLFQGSDTTYLNGKPKQYSLHTLDLDWTYKGFNFWTEIGVGQYKSPAQKPSFGEAILLKVKTPSRYTGIPFEVMFYQISPNFVNVNATFLNSSVLEIQPRIGGVGAALLTPSGGPMTDVVTTVNNRRGLSLNGELEVGDKLKLNAGLGFSQELKISSPEVSFSHRINSFQMSRFALFTGNYGPYGRLNSFFRGTYEVTKLTDTTATGGIDFKKQFASADLAAKFTTKIFKKNFFAFLFSTFNTAQKKFSPLPVVSDKAWIRAWYNELDLYMELHPKLIVSGYGGLEMIKGNEFTDLDNVEIIPGYEMSGLARNQLNLAIGGGLDYTLGKNAGLFLRYRWYSFEDKSFQLDKWKGNEVTLEVKVYF